MYPRSILLIKPGSMGDVIHALPVASAIHEAWSDSKITWIVDPRWRPLLDGNPAVFKTHDFPRQSFRGLAGKCRAIRWYSELADLRPDLVIDLQGLLRSGLMAKTSGAKNVIGLSDSREFASLFYTKVVEVGRKEHAVTRYLRCLPALGITIPEKSEFTFPKQKLTQHIELEDEYVVVHPFARGEKKSLSANVILAMTAELALSANIQIVIAGMGDVPFGIGPSVVNLVGKTSLQELVGLLRGARFVVSVDSGPMHLAAGLGVPVLGIHTWSDPRLVGPYSKESWIWQGGELCPQDLLRIPLPERTFTVEDARNVALFVAERVSCPG